MSIIQFNIRPKPRVMELLSRMTPYYNDNRTATLEAAIEGWYWTTQTAIRSLSKRWGKQEWGFLAHALHGSPVLEVVPITGERLAHEVAYSHEVARMGDAWAMDEEKAAIIKEWLGKSKKPPYLAVWMAEANNWVRGVVDVLRTLTHAESASVIWNVRKYWMNNIQEHDEWWLPEWVPTPVPDLDEPEPETEENT